MGFVNRKKSGNIFAGSRLVVDGQGIYNVKILKFGPERQKSPLEFFRPVVVPQPIPAPLCDFNGIVFITPTITPTNTSTPTVTPTVTPTNTPTPTTIFIPPGAVPIPVLVGYQTLSPVENIVISTSLEDMCLSFYNLSIDNINIESQVVDTTTYYFDFDTLTLYNSVTNTFAEDGYYLTDAGILYVTNGLSEILTLEELLGLCPNITPTPTPTQTPTPT